jgi:hypothetical protein
MLLLRGAQEATLSATFGAATETIICSLSGTLVRKLSELLATLSPVKK